VGGEAEYKEPGSDISFEYRARSGVKLEKLKAEPGTID